MTTLVRPSTVKRFLVQTKSYVDAMLVEGNALAVDHLVIEDDDYLDTRRNTERDAAAVARAACIHDLMFTVAEEHPGDDLACKVLKRGMIASSLAVRKIADALGPSTRTTASRCCWSGTRPWSRRFMGS